MFLILFVTFLYFVSKWLNDLLEVFYDTRRQRIVISFYVLDPSLNIISWNGLYQSEKNKFI